MVYQESGLHAQMQLFWHNHFTTELRKVKLAQQVFRQHEKIHRNAVGNYGILLDDMVHDAAMNKYLDNIDNKKGQPNENLARELLELFTMGEGNYTEQDIKEIARALSGYIIRKKTGELTFIEKRHDQGTKTIFGNTDTFDSKGVVKLLLQQDRTAVYIIEQLWQHFIAAEPTTESVKRIANDFRESNYDISVALTGILTDPAFWEISEYGSMIKSPIELTVGVLRSLEIPLRDRNILAKANRQLGQNLFDPPNVKGWPGGNAWITPPSLLIRQGVLHRFIRGLPGLLGPALERGRNMGLKAGDTMMRPSNSDEITMKEKKSAREMIAIGPVSPEHWLIPLAISDGSSHRQELVRVLFQRPPFSEMHNNNAKLVQTLDELLQDPAYQLK
jgi:uncharacterized protein (DUF1800 family)